MNRQKFYKSASKNYDEHFKRIYEEISEHIMDSTENDKLTSEEKNYAIKETKKVIEKLYAEEYEDNDTHPLNLNPRTAPPSFYREAIAEYSDVYDKYET
jgi:hypothetical protein